jgi:hypothetical protein
LDRQVVDILTPTEEGGQMEVCFVPRAILESAPRIAVRVAGKTSEYYGRNFNQPMFDSLLGDGLYLSTSSSNDDWQERNAAHFSAIHHALSETALNTIAYRYAQGHPRDFKKMFSGIAGQSVRLQIEDPYLASSPRNRGAVVAFLAKLQELGVKLLSVTLIWRPVRPGTPGQYSEEMPEEQQRDLSKRLAAIGLGSSIVHLKPRTSRTHFHDRVVLATVENQRGSTAYRWDVSSGIDNLMERERQCSVFLTVQEPHNPLPRTSLLRRSA